MVRMQELMQLAKQGISSGKEHIALIGHRPVRRKRGQTGFEKLSCFCFAQSKQTPQFQDDTFPLREVVALFPGPDSIVMHAQLLSQHPLTDAFALAKHPEHISEWRAEHKWCSLLS